MTEKLLQVRNLVKNFPAGVGFLGGSGEMVHAVDSALVSLNRCAIGDKIVIVAGSPPGSPGKTNALRVHRIGDAIALPYP